MGISVEFPQTSKQTKTKIGYLYGLVIPLLFILQIWKEQAEEMSACVCAAVR